MGDSLKKILLILLGVSALFGLAVAGGVVFYLDTLSQELPDVAQLKDYKPPLPTEILTRNGTKIGEIYKEKRYPISVGNVSKKTLRAFLAAEDANFYNHFGVDIPGFLRASIRYVFRTGGVQGGSTITQQIAKNLLLTRERTIVRKIKDIMLALRIEKEFSKNQILQLYLNTIYLGNMSYGLEAAARNYFRKKHTELTLGEASLLAGLPPAPSRYAPTRSLTKAKARQRYVLGQMVKNGWITKKEASQAYAEPLNVYRAEAFNTEVAPWFFMEVKQQLESLLGEEVLEKGGYKVYTTMDLELQDSTQKRLNEHLKKYDKKRGFQGPRKRHGQKVFQQHIHKILNEPRTDDGFEKAIVVDIYPWLDAAAIVSQQGLGMLLLEDHRWALSTSRGKGRRVLDFSDILKIGDEIRVRQNEKRKSPRRVINAVKRLNPLKKYLSFYPAGPAYKGLRYYELVDVEQVQAAAIIMDSSNGDILALVGGKDFNSSQFNRATQARRQIGSSVKALYYALAQEYGFAPSSRIESPPIVVGDWKPSNYDNSLLGKTTLRRSLVMSYNLPSIQLFQALGQQRLRPFFRKLGLNWKEYDLSLSLGSGAATVLQLAQAYSIFSNLGTLTEAQYIKKVVSPSGEVVLDSSSHDLKVSPIYTQEEKQSFSEEENPYDVISPASAYVTVQLLKDVIRWGTATRAAGVSKSAAGKTGTTNSYTDAWFMGVLPGYVGGVWFGFDDARKSLGRGGSGGSMAAPLWKQVMEPLVAKYPQRSWEKPEDVVVKRMSPETGKPLKHGGVLVSFKKGYEPGSHQVKHIEGLLQEGQLLEEEEEGKENFPSVNLEFEDSSSLRGLN